MLTNDVNCYCKPGGLVFDLFLVESSTILKAGAGELIEQIAITAGLKRLQCRMKFSTHQGGKDIVGLSLLVIFRPLPDEIIKINQL